MKICVSSDDSEVSGKLKGFTIVDEIDDADIVLILPGGLGTYYDLFKAIKENKKIYLYNKDFFYTPVIKNLYELHLGGMIEKVPSEYMNIECDLDNIIEKMKER